MNTVALVLGPLTVLLSGQVAHLPWRPTILEILSVATLTGTAATLVVDGVLTPAQLPLALIGPAAAVVDAHEGRLPDILTGPLLIATLAIGLATTRDAPQLLAIAAAAGALAVVLATFAGELVGWGDAKLLPTVAITLADAGALLDGVLVISALITLTAAAVATFDRRALVPYGPAFIIGGLAVAAAGV